MVLVVRNDLKMGKGEFNDYKIRFEPVLFSIGKVAAQVSTLII
jgi:hypothetical protein